MLAKKKNNLRLNILLTKTHGKSGKFGCVLKEALFSILILFFGQLMSLIYSLVLLVIRCTISHVFFAAVDCMYIYGRHM